MLMRGYSAKTRSRLDNKELKRKRAHAHFLGPRARSHDNPKDFGRVQALKVHPKYAQKVSSQGKQKRKL